MAYEKYPNQTGQNWPVSTQYATHPGSAVGVPVSPQYDTFPSGTVVTPLTILGSALLQWHRADQGVTIATGVSQWNDLTANGRNSTQGTGAAQPAFDASGGPNGTPFLNFDGTDDFLQSTGFALPDPTTTPSLCFLVFRQDGWTAGDRIFGDSGGFRLVLYQNPGAAPFLRITATVDGVANNGAAIGTWVFGLAYFSDTTADYLQLKGGAKATGTSVASLGGINRQIGCSGSASFCDFSLAEYGWVNRDLTAPELAQMVAYIDARYGAGLTS